MILFADFPFLHSSHSRVLCAGSWYITAHSDSKMRNVNKPSEIYICTHGHIIQILKVPLTDGHRVFWTCYWRGFLKEFLWKPFHVFSWPQGVTFGYPHWLTEIVSNARKLPFLTWALSLIIIVACSVVVVWKRWCFQARYMYTTVLRAWGFTRDPILQQLKDVDCRSFVAAEK